MNYKNGIDFLNKLFFDMRNSSKVNYTALKSDTPEMKIDRYLDWLERIHVSALESNTKLSLLKSFYYDKYIIKELPESYLELQKQIAREEEYGNITIYSLKKIL